MHSRWIHFNNLSARLEKCILDQIDSKLQGHITTQTFSSIRTQTKFPKVPALTNITKVQPLRYVTVGTISNVSRVCRL